MKQLIKRLSEPKLLLGLSLGYTVLITVLSLVPTSNLPKVKFEWSDKIAHLFIYLGLSFIWLLFIHLKFRILSSKVAALVIATCFFYGIVIEVLQQLFVTSGQADLYDVIANAVGILLGLLVFEKLKYLFEVKNNF